MNTPHPRCVIKPPKADIYSEAPQPAGVVVDPSRRRRQIPPIRPHQAFDQKPPLTADLDDRTRRKLNKKLTQD